MADQQNERKRQGKSEFKNMGKGKLENVENWNREKRVYKEKETCYTTKA